MIAVKNISKSYGNIKAISEVTFNITKGGIFGLLGPNGAGKTTLINILSTLVKPDKGNVIIDKYDISEYPNKIKTLIGVVPQDVALYENLSAYENLMFWGSLYNISKPLLKQRINNVLEAVGLYERRNYKINTYSGGMKRRINLASSILHNPKVLLLDEPTVGVDPQSRNRIFEVIKQLNNKGITIVYTTHYMEEAERLCKTIAIIDKGKIAALGTLNKLKELSKVADILKVKINNFDTISLYKLKTIYPSLKTDTENKNIEIECLNINNDISKVINNIQNTGGFIESIESHHANLEQVFLKLTGKQLRD